MACFLYVNVAIGRTGNHCSLCSVGERIICLYPKVLYWKRRKLEIYKGSETLAGQLCVRNLSLNVVKNRQTTLY